MSPSFFRPALVAGVLLSAGLPAVAQQAAAPQPRQRNVITAEEIAALQGVEDAYQVVLRLRPEFLRVRARSQFRAPIPGPEEQDMGLAGRSSTSPTLSVARAPAGGGGKAPNPDAPEFTSGRSAGTGGARSGASSRSGSATGGGSLTGGAPEEKVGMMGPTYTEEGGIAVYVGNMMQGGVEELTRLLAADIQEIRYLSPTEAQFRFGPRHGAGVIMVTLK